MSRTATSMRSGDAAGTAPAMRTYSKKSYRWSPLGIRQRPLGNRDAVLGLRNDVVDNGLQVVRFLEYGELAVGAGPASHDLAGILDILARAKLVHHIIDELEQFLQQDGERHFLALAEVDQLRRRAEPRGP